MKLAHLIALSALASPSFAQEFERDLRPPDHSQWRNAGTQVAFASDGTHEWAVVGGWADFPASADSLPALFRRDLASGEWTFVRSLLLPGTGVASALEHITLDPPHLLLNLIDFGSSEAHVQPFLLDEVTGVWNPGARLFSPLPNPDRFGELIRVSGDTAIVSDFGRAGGGAVFRYEFDPVAEAWGLAETWSSTTGGPGTQPVGGLGFSMALDDGVAAVFDLNDDTSQSSKVQIYTRDAAGAWTHSQTLGGGMGSQTPGWLYGRALALDGDALVLSNNRFLELYRRQPGGLFTLQEEIDLGPNGVAADLDIEGDTIAVGRGFDCDSGPGGCDGSVEIYRNHSCLGSGWRRTHRLESAYRHNGTLLLGRVLEMVGDRVLVGGEGYTILNGPNHGLRPGIVSDFGITRDCDGNGIEDACDIAAGAFDVDGDGVLDLCEGPGRRFCSPGVPTYLGTPAYALLQGSDQVGDDRIFFTFTNVPQGSAGLMLASLSPGFTANPGGSRGNLCLGQPIGRFRGNPHSYWFAGPDGIISQRYPLVSPLPGGGPMLPGDTWYFQGWFREQGSSNFTDAIQWLMD